MTKITPLTSDILGAPLNCTLWLHQFGCNKLS